MAQRLPPLNALRAFEAAARHESFSAAAKELHVTHAAVSHQIRALEDWLGVPLFERSARSVRLNERGRSYLPLVRGVFDQLKAGTDTLLRAARDEALVVTAPHAFAVRWLAPRLGQLWNTHPDLDLRLKEVSWIEDASFSESDVSIRIGDGNWTGVEAVRLMAGSLTPTCSPQLLANGPPLERPADLLRFKLLHLHDHDGWRDWLRRAGIDDAGINRGPVFDDANFIYSAVLAGQGIGLLHTALTRRELAAGLLVRPFESGPGESLDYYIAYPPGGAEDPRIARFRDWLLGQVAQDDPPGP